MQMIILVLLVPIVGLIATALYFWRSQGWRNKKHLIVMLIVLAAVLQLVNMILMVRVESGAAG